MTWEKIVIPEWYRQIDGAEGFQLLNDGRLLVAGPIGSYVITPDERGRYSTGSLSPIALLPSIGGLQARSYGGILVIHKDGKVSKWGGHSNAHPNHNNVWIYDPAVNQWSNGGSAPYVGHDTGSSPLQLDNGDVVKPMVGAEARLNTSTLSLTSATHEQTSRNQAWRVAERSGDNDPFVPQEAGRSRMPNGKFITFPQVNQYESKPVYLHLWDPVNGSDTVAAARPDYPTKVLYRGKSQPFQAFNGSNYLGFGLTYSNVQGALDGSNLRYELPAFIYWPRIGKVVGIGGGMGEVWTYDPNTEQLSIQGQIPQTPPPVAGFAVHSQIHPDHFGQTVAQLLAGPSVKMIANTQFSGVPGMVIQLTGGQFIKLQTQATNPVRNLAGDPISIVQPGASFQVMGPWEVVFGPRGDDPNAGVVPANAEVGSRPRSRTSSESSAVILPNGNLFFNPGMAGGGGTSASGEMCEYDGTSFFMESTPCREEDFVVNYANLPTGELISSWSNDLFIRPAPATRDQSNAPVIDSYPKVTAPGSTFTLSGRQLFGRHVGNEQGDDWNGKNNHPIVKLTNNATGNVRYVPCFNYSTFSIAPNVPGTASVSIPGDMPKGSYTMHVISSGNESQPGQIEIENLRVGSVSTIVPRRGY
jgi:hypothetical protein